MPILQLGHDVQLLFTGHAFFPALVRALDAAREEIRLETYIFHDDASGQLVLDALVRAAERGVQVYVVVDGIGTPQWPAAWAERLQRCGAQWHQFLPLGSVGLLLPGRWRRLHRKLCVVDAETVFCGGINVLDDRVDPELGALASARFDFAVEVRGPLVAEVHAAMHQFWQRLQVTRQLESGRLKGLKEALRTWRTPASLGVRRHALAHGVRAGLLLRDNVQHRTRIERAYRQAIARAKSEVLIANAYFLPGIKLRRALMHAAKRGVRVRLLLQGQYEYFMQFHGAKAFYGGLLDAGVEIYEYQAGFLHAKVAVVDRRWATVGSSNLDPLSLLLAREANVVVEDKVFARGLQDHLEQAIHQSSTQLQRAQFAKRPLWQRIKDYTAYSLMRISLFLSGADY